MMRSVTIPTVRQLNIVKQHLDNSPTPTLLETFRDLACIQLDPISHVARTHELVLWSRVGKYDEAELEKLRFEDFHVFEYWAHAASMVLTEDYPLFDYYMRRYPTGQSNYAKQLKIWVDEHTELKDHILNRLSEAGKLSTRHIESIDPTNSQHTGWSSGRDVNRMMEYLWTSGQVVVAGRKRTERLWGLTDHHLPEWTPRHELTPDQITQQAIIKSIKALGIATEAQIKRHFTRGRYTHSAEILKQLVKAQIITPLNVLTDEGVALWKTPAYIHNEDLPLLERIEAGEFSPRTVLLSPFDNLICDRERTEQLWDFYYRIEIYVPKEQRVYGYYVLPILQGDRLVGRIDAQYNKKTKTFIIHNIYFEDNVPVDIPAVRQSIETLGNQLGAVDIQYTGTQL
jgi:uncharacterized protein YcaQ